MSQSHAKPSKRRREQDPEVTRGEHRRIVTELIDLLWPYRGWVPRVGELEKRWHSHGDHQQLVDYYLRHVDLLEAWQVKYLPQDRRRRRWKDHLSEFVRPVPPPEGSDDRSQKKHRSAKMVFASTTMLMKHGVVLDEIWGEDSDDPHRRFCAPELPIAVSLRCRVFCNNCVQAAIDDLRTLRRGLNRDRIMMWSDLTNEGRWIVEYFETTPGTQDRFVSTKEILTGAGCSQTRHFWNAVNALMKGNVLLRKQTRNGYRYVARPRRMPPLIAPRPSSRS